MIIKISIPVITTLDMITTLIGHGTLSELAHVYYMNDLKKPDIW